MGKRFVAIPADALLGELRAIGAAISAKGGRIAEGRQGGEIAVDLYPPHGHAMVRVLTSLPVGGGEVRASGKDALRLMLCTATADGVRVIGPNVALHRTAPADGDRVAAFLHRLRARLREMYALALRVPKCPVCERAMVQRTSANGSFMGCSGYPQCRTTRPLFAPPTASSPRSEDRGD